MKVSSKSLFRDRIRLAFVLALVGASDLIFPGDRYPYVPFTLAASFVGYTGGLSLGLLCSAFMGGMAAIGLLLGATHISLLSYILSLLAASGVGSLVAHKRVWLILPRKNASRGLSLTILGALFAGAAGEFVHSLLLGDHLLLPGLGFALKPSWVVATIYSTSANGFGCLILSLILWDTRERQLMTANQVQAEQEIAALRLSQLGELQARLHPHFLFNALAGIAGLCVTEPLQAERGVTALASLLRQFLRTSPEIAIPLQEELTTVRTYLSLEKLRLGDRMQVYEDLTDETLSMLVPRFCLQVPVENAVQHGLVPTGQPGTITIIARRRRGHLLLAVGDNGVGPAFPAEPSKGKIQADRVEGDPDRAHGLTLLAARLQLTYGHTARLRLSGRRGRGSLCVLRLPNVIVPAKKNQ